MKTGAQKTYVFLTTVDFIFCEYPLTSSNNPVTLICVTLHHHYTPSPSVSFWYLIFDTLHTYLHFRFDPLSRLTGFQ